MSQHQPFHRTLLRPHRSVSGLTSIETLNFFTRTTKRTTVVLRKRFTDDWVPLVPSNNPSTPESQSVPSDRPVIGLLSWLPPLDGSSLHLLSRRFSPVSTVDRFDTLENEGNPHLTSTQGNPRVPDPPNSP